MVTPGTGSAAERLRRGRGRELDQGGLELAADDRVGDALLEQVARR